MSTHICVVQPWEEASLFSLFFFVLFLHTWRPVVRQEPAMVLAHWLRGLGVKLCSRKDAWHYFTILKTCSCLRFRGPSSFHPSEGQTVLNAHGLASCQSPQRSACFIGSELQELSELSLHNSRVFLFRSWKSDYYRNCVHCYTRYTHTRGSRAQHVGCDSTQLQSARSLLC